MKTLELMVDRCLIQICVEDILYIEVKDKLCTIHRKNQDDIQIFMSISKLEKQLPADAFVRISRCYLVSCDCIEKIQKEIVLTDGKSLAYSARKKSQIMKAYYDYLEKGWAKRRDKSSNKNFYLELQKKYETMVDFPVAFIVLRAKAALQTQKMYFELVFGNYQAEKLLEIPRGKLEGRNFMECLFEEESAALARWLAQTAFHGLKERNVEKNTKLQKAICMEGYQIIYGYCACLLWDVTKDMNSQYIKGIDSKYSKEERKDLF